LRVLHLVHGSPRLQPSAGGTERYVDALARATAAPVLTRSTSPPAGLVRLDDGAYPLWVARVPSPAAPVFRDTWSVPAVEAALSDVLTRERPDIVHIHHLAHLGLGCAVRARAAGARVVITLHDYHLLCVRGQLVDRDLSRCDGPAPERCAACVAEHLRAAPGLHRLGRIAGALGVRRAARGLVAAPPPGPAIIARAADRIAAARRALEAAHAVLSPSSDLARRVSALGFVAPERLHVHDLPLVSPIPPAPSAGDGPLRFLFVGSLIPTKGPDVLVEAFSRLPPGVATLTVRGPPAAFDGQPGWSEALIQRLDDTHGARWGGVFGDDERAAIYADADVLVVPSIWRENSPLVVREALAAGLRVITSDIGGVSEIAPNARRVAPGAPAALAAALAAEVGLGRGRAAPRAFPMAPHLETLGRIYRGLV